MSINIQNLPRDKKQVRSCFTPFCGCYVIGDYEALEMRLLAYYMAKTLGDHSLANEFYDNKDVHQESADMLGISRFAGKTFNFSMIYGGGVATIVRQLGIEKKEAWKLLQEFKKARPGAVTLLKMAEQALAERGYVRTISGRPRRLPEAVAYKALNAIIQGSGADMMKRAIIQCSNRCIENTNHIGRQMNLWLTRHDELGIDCGIFDKGNARRAIVQSMTENMWDVTEYVDLKVEVSVTDGTWADAK